MKISRLILRKLILSEVKKTLSRDHLVEGLMDKLAAVGADELDDAIQSAKDAAGSDFLDDVIRDTIETDTFKATIEEMDDETIKSIFGKLRGSLRGSALSKLRDKIIAIKPGLKNELE